MLLDLTAAIGRASSVDAVYDAALEAIERGLGVARASTLFFDRERVVRSAAWRRLSDDYRRAVEGHTPWTPDTTEATPIVVADVTRDPGLAPYLATIAAEGIAAMVFVPLTTDRGVIGKFMLSYGEPHEMTAAELQMASVIAAQVAFGVQRIRAELARRAATEYLRAVVDGTPECVKIVAADGTLQDAARQKDEFLAVLAHELRNPLAPIRTALQLLEVAGDDAARRARACGVMGRQLHQLVRLVDDLQALTNALVDSASSCAGAGAGCLFRLATYWACNRRCRTLGSVT